MALDEGGEDEAGGRSRTGNPSLPFSHPLVVEMELKLGQRHGRTGRTRINTFASNTSPLVSREQHISLLLRRASRWRLLMRATKAPAYHSRTGNGQARSPPFSWSKGGDQGTAYRHA